MQKLNNNTKSSKPIKKDNIPQNSSQIQFKIIKTHQKEKILEIKPELIRLIKTAKKSIYFSTWLINSQEITNTLLDKANEPELRGKVYGLMAVEQNDSIYRRTNNEKDIKFNLAQAPDTSEEGNLNADEINRNFECLNLLSGNNTLKTAIEIRGHSYAHAKFLIVDEEYVLISSANFTFASLDYGSNPKLNRTEIGIVTNDPNIVKPLVLLFKDIFLHHYNTRFPFYNPIAKMKDEDTIIFHQPIIHRDYPNLEKMDSVLVFNPASERPNLDLIWTYDFKKNLGQSKTFERKKLLNSISEAIIWEESIVLLMAYSITKLENTGFEDVLIKKIENGKLVVIILDQLNYERIPGKLREKNNGSNKNFFILKHPGLHAKMVLTSKNWAIFSANFDGEHGLASNFEVGVISNHSYSIYRDLMDFYQKIMKECGEEKKVGGIINLINQLPLKTSISQKNTNIQTNKTVKNIPCQSCNRKFATTQALKEHMRRKHPN